MTSVLRSDAADRLIVALDVGSRREAIQIVDRLDGTCRWFKVGMELYYAAGRAVIDDLVQLGFQVFLDLKVHDIPATAAGAVRSVADAGASLLTVHASGGRAMLEAAAEAASRPGAPQILAVTVLTSMSEPDLAEVGVEETPLEQVLRLARLAESCGIPGMVCSAEEVGRLRGELQTGATLVVPGIRPEGAEVGDQRRIASPASAIASGASMLVVGRPITRAARPAAAAEAILKEIATAMGESPRAVVQNDPR